MLDSIYHISLKLIKIAFLGQKRQYLSYFMQHYNGRRYITLQNL